MTTVSLQAVHRGLFAGYDTGAFFDEMFLGPGEPRPHYAKLFQMLASMPATQFEDRRNLPGCGGLQTAWRASTPAFGTTWHNAAGVRPGPGTSRRRTHLCRNLRRVHDGRPGATQ